MPTKDRTESSRDTLIRYLKSQHYRFITPTPLTHQRVNARHGDAPGLKLADAFGWSRPFAPSLLPQDLFAALEADGIIVPQGGGWISTVRASTVGEDLFLHSAYPTLDADAVFLGPDTYRFCRLIEQTLQTGPSPRRAVDIGCGTGAGGVAVARNSSCTDIVWTDISERALDLCAANLRGCGFVAPQLTSSDLFAGLDGQFDLIVANPPYLNDPLKRAYRHGGGAFGSALSLRIVAESIPCLSPGGRLVLYTGSPIVDGCDHFKREIGDCLSRADVRWTYDEIDPDVFGEELELPDYERVDRIAVVAMIMRKNGGS